jgi:hypothetical protein
MGGGVKTTWNVSLLPFPSPRLQPHLPGRIRSRVALYIISLVLFSSRGASGPQLRLPAGVSFQYRLHGFQQLLRAFCFAKHKVSAYRRR